MPSRPPRSPSEPAAEVDPAGGGPPTQDRPAELPRRVGAHPLADAARVLAAREHIGDLDLALRFLGLARPATDQAAAAMAAAATPDDADVAEPADGEGVDAAMPEEADPEPEDFGPAAPLPEDSARSTAWPPRPERTMIAYLLVPDADTEDDGRRRPRIQYTPIPDAVQRPTPPPPSPNAASWRVARKILDAGPQVDRRGHIDIRRCVERISRGEALVSLPRKAVRRRAGRIEVLVDLRAARGVFDDDVDQLVRALHALGGGPTLRRRGLTGRDGAWFAGVGPVWSFNPVESPPSGAWYVLIAGGDQDPADWSAGAAPLAAALSRRHPASVVWLGEAAPPGFPSGMSLPAPAATRPPGDGPLATLADLDVSSLARDGHGLHDGVLRLACALAPWPFVPFALLRHVRGLMEPGSGGGAEAALRDSPLVDACAVDGLVLESSFRVRALEVLREARRAGGPRSAVEADLVVLRSFVESVTPRLSPLLVVETELAWDYVLLDEPTLAERIDERLRDVLFSSVIEGRPGLLAWASGAGARLPAACMRGEAAWWIHQLGVSRSLQMTPVPTPSVLTPGGLVALRSDQLPLVVHGVFRQPGSIEFGPPSDTRSVGIVLLGTEPDHVLFLEESNGEGTHRRRVLLRPGQVTRVPCGSGAVVLENLVGQRFTMGALVDGHCPEAKKADAVIRKALAAQARRDRLAATVIRPVEAGYVVLIHEIGGTAFVRRAGLPLLPGDEVTVSIDRVYEEKRWISAYVGGYSPAVAAGRTSSMLRVPRVWVPEMVEAGDVFPARVMKHGQVRGERCSAHVYLDPGCLLGSMGFDTRPGYLRFPQAVSMVDGEWFPPVGAAMEVVATGRVDDQWEFRLRVAGAPLPTTCVPLRRGQRVRATVTAVLAKGLFLEGDSGEQLWMSRHDTLPFVGRLDPLPYQPGDVVEGWIIGSSNPRRGRQHLTMRPVPQKVAARS